MLIDRALGDIEDLPGVTGRQTARGPGQNLAFAFRDAGLFSIGKVELVFATALPRV
jgi:hypothetical protein